MCYFDNCILLYLSLHWSGRGVPPTDAPLRQALWAGDAFKLPVFVCCCAEPEVLLPDIELPSVPVQPERDFLGDLGDALVVQVVAGLREGLQAERGADDDEEERHAEEGGVLAERAVEGRGVERV